MKTYKLLQESPLYPLGTTAKQNEAGSYDIYVNNNPTFDDLEAFQIEDRPNIWELQEEKKEVENGYRAFKPEDAVLALLSFMAKKKGINSYITQIPELKMQVFPMNEMAFKSASSRLTKLGLIHLPHQL